MLEIQQPTLLGTKSWRAGEESTTPGRAGPLLGLGAQGPGPQGGGSWRCLPAVSFPLLRLCPLRAPSSPSPAPVLQIAGRLNSLRASLMDSEVETLRGRDSRPHSYHNLTPCGPKAVSEFGLVGTLEGCLVLEVRHTKPGT